jgi:hypothetical protein
MTGQDNPTSERERIEQELVRARQERETFIRQAERQVAMFDGAIYALEKLLGARQEQADG